MHNLNSVQYKKAKNTIMSRMKLPLTICLTMILLLVQVRAAFAGAPAQGTTPLSGTVQSITLESDPTTGVLTVLVNLMDVNQVTQTVRISQETAMQLGLILLDGDGNPTINEPALGEVVEIDPGAVIPDHQEPRHPVANALATFFSDLQGIDYDTIMSAHQDGVGFGVIAQALWLTSQLGGDSQTFQDLIYAKQHNDYTAFSNVTDDGTTPKSWGQLRKALLDKKNLGQVMSHHENNGNNEAHANSSTNSPAKNDKDKKDKTNNGNGNANSNKNDHKP